MKTRQIKRLISYLETGKICRENAAIIAMISGMMKQVQQFDQLLLEILETMYKRAEPIKQITEEKIETRKKLVKYS